MKKCHVVVMLYIFNNSSIGSCLSVWLLLGCLVSSVPLFFLSTFLIQFRCKSFSFEYIRICLLYVCFCVYVEFFRIEIYPTRMFWLLKTCGTLSMKMSRNFAVLKCVNLLFIITTESVLFFIFILSVTSSI